MAAAAQAGPFATKAAERRFSRRTLPSCGRAVGAVDLTAFGIGAIIGTGVFVILGEAIGDSGPAIVVSFVLAA
jgi:amino acid permease